MLVIIYQVWICSLLVMIIVKHREADSESWFNIYEEYRKDYRNAKSKDEIELVKGSERLYRSRGKR